MDEYPYAETTDNPLLFDVNYTGSAVWSLQNFSNPVADPNNTISGLKMAFTYSLLYRIVASTIGSFIFCCGLIGNVMVVIVVIRTKSMHTPTNCYLLSLSVADSVVLLSGTLPFIPEPFFYINQWPWGRVMCSALVFLQYLATAASSLSITAFTVERYIAICHPIRAQTLCTVGRAKRIIAILWIFSFLYCSPWLGLTITLTRMHRYGISFEICTFRLQRDSYLVYYMADLVTFYVIPLMIEAVLYGLLAKILCSSHVPMTPGKGFGKDVNRKQATSRIQVVRMLIVVVGLFATLWMPYRVMVVYNSFAKKRYLDLWFLLFCRVMVYINSAINPILYNAMSVKFRRAFRRLLCCDNGNKEYSHYVYTDAPSEAPTNHVISRKLTKKMIIYSERDTSDS